MFKPINYSVYKKIQRMTLRDFNKWVRIVWESGYDSGIADTREEYKEAQDNIVSEVTEEQLLNILLSIKGIGPKRAEQAVKAITKTEDINA